MSIGLARLFAFMICATRRTWGSRNRIVPDGVGEQAERLFINASPGIICAAIPVRQSSGCRTCVDANDRTSTRGEVVTGHVAFGGGSEDISVYGRKILLIVRLLYGTGLHIPEAIRLRVEDVDFTRNTILVREAKGSKDRAAARPGVYHAGVKTTMIYTHVLKVGGGVISPLDRM